MVWHRVTKRHQWPFSSVFIYNLWYARIHVYDFRFWIRYCCFCSLWNFHVCLLFLGVPSSKKSMLDSTSAMLLKRTFCTKNMENFLNSELYTPFPFYKNYKTHTWASWFLTIQPKLPSNIFKWILIFPAKISLNNS